MFRAMLAGTTVLAMLAAHSRKDDNVLLDKKESLTAKDEIFKTDDGRLKNIVGNPCKVYKLKLTKGEKVTIRMMSQKIDSVVVVENDKSKVLDFNDDQDVNTFDSKLSWTAPEDGEYRIIATCFINLIQEKYGEFHLTVEKTK